MKPAEVPGELFDLAFTITEDSKVVFNVQQCRMCKSLVPDDGREHHRKFHVDMARMLNEALGERRAS